MAHDGAETDATRGDLRPSANHPQPIPCPNYIPKFASKPLTFIGRPERELGASGWMLPLLAKGRAEPAACPS
jgi:hypothetical protein